MATTAAQSQSENKRAWLLALATAGVLSYTWWRIAWVSDDAYLMFRTIDVWFAGHGPNFNPGQRVFGATSPLWFLLVSGGRLFHSNLYWATLTLSGLFSALTLFFAWRILRDPLPWTVFSLLFLGSRVIIDYSSSGLETPLTYALLTAFVWRYSRLFDSEPTERRFWLFGVVAGLILVTRHDLVLAVGPALAWAFIRFRGTLSARKWIQLMTVCALPILLWTLFSLFYYGALFPPTAYAKLSYAKYGDSSEVLMQGVKNLLVIIYDPISILILLAGCLACIRYRDWNSAFIVGGVLYLSVFVYHGGDWMDARIYVPFLILLLPITARYLSLVLKSYVLPAALAGALICLLWPEYPWAMSFPDNIANHRRLMKGWNDFYRGRASVTEPTLLRCPDWTRMPEANKIDPDARVLFTKTAFAAKIEPTFIAQSYACALIFREVEWRVAGVQLPIFGIFAYFSGPEKFMIERMLCDPLLTRLPPSHQEKYLHYTQLFFRPGHVWHDLPQGYVETIVRGGNRIEDPAIARLYDDVRLATKGDLLAPGRFWAIWRLNTGHDYGTDAAWEAAWGPLS